MAALSDKDRLLETYRHLRMTLVALACLLLIGSLGGSLFYGQLMTSISANYNGLLRNVFVGALVGIGACLVAVRGRPLEDYALNLAGFYALFVAFVPPSLPKLLDAITDEKLKDAALNSVRLSVGTVVLVAIAFLIVERRSGHWAGDALTTLGGRPKGFYRLAQFLSFVFVALIVIGMFWTDYLWVLHPVAAVFMIGSMAVAVACNGWPKAAGEDDIPENKVYQRIALLMVPGVFIVLAAALAINQTRSYTVAIIEWWSVILFAVFWAYQTKQEWGHREN